MSAEATTRAPQRSFRGRVALAALIYTAAGLVSAALAARAGSHGMVMAWRVSAWIVSAITFGVHIVHEQYHLRMPPQVTAFRASLASAFGSLALAVAANVNAVVNSPVRPSALLGSAIVIWPVMTMIPAFLVALLLATALRRMTSSGDS